MEITILSDDSIMGTMDFFRHAKLIGFEFADNGAPVSGVAYHRWSAYKYKGKLYIVEHNPVNDKLVATIKVIDY